MAKGGKGRKGGGGGGGKTRKYSRDNNGKFASTGTGATARGGRLLTAKGNKRTARALAGKTKTIEATGQKGVLAKPKGLKPGSIKPKAATAAAKPAALKPISPKPANKLRTRLNPAAKSPILPRTRLPGTISKNKQLRTAANRESAFQRRFGRAYNLGSNRGAGLSVKKAKSERTRGKALDLYTGRKRLDGTEATVGRFPRSRTSTGFQSPSSNIKLARRFAPGAPKPANATAKPPAPKPTIARAKPGAFRPGQLMNANAFPTNAIAKKPKIKDGYKDVTADMTQTQRRQTIKNNIQLSLDTAKKQTPWLPATIKGNSRSGTVAFVALNLQTGGRRLQVNSSHPRWATPIKSSIEGRRTGEFASAKPAHVINHEIGHAKHRTMGKQQYMSQNDRTIARRVSKYAATEVNEFVAEVRGARKVGSRFDAQIMGKYREYSGLSAKPAPRFRPTAKAKAKAKAAKR